MPRITTVLPLYPRVTLQSPLVVHSQTDYVCFDFLPRHHNVIRYRRGRELIRNEFHTVCAWKQFEGSDGVNQVGADGSWLYNIMVGESWR